MSKAVEITIGIYTYAINTKYVMNVEHVGKLVIIDYAHGLKKNYSFTNDSQALDAYKRIIEAMNS